MPDLLESQDAERGNRPITTTLPLEIPAKAETAVRLKTDPVLVFERVSKWYGPVIGVNQVSLELRGGITGLVGHNGAGKSTLMQLASGQIRPELGRVLIGGIDAWESRAKMHVGFCPDLDQFYEDLSGRAFLRTLARLTGYSKSEANRRTEAILELVGMADRADKRLAGYSKGMRQRIKLGQALLHDPKLLLLDEPLSGIDPVGRREMVALFRLLARQGKCLLISSHELEELEKLTDHIAIMAAGRIAAVGTLSQIRELLDRHPHSIRLACDQNAILAKAILGWDEVVGLDRDERFLTVRARNPRDFFQKLSALVIEEHLEIRHMETLDESTHDVLHYLLGGKRA